MKRVLLLMLSCSIVFASCGGGAKKKVLVMGKGTLSAGENSITLKEGSGYAETLIELSGDKETVLTVEGSGIKSVTIPAEGGYYILNLRKDTIVGAKQNLGKDLSSSRIITQEELKLKIDSLIQLTTGVNVKAGGSNFNIAPGIVTKVSANENARIYGPFTKIPASIKPDPNGKELELFKFYTNNEMRELIEKLKAQTF